jgi:hypothetical protein
MTTIRVSESFAQGNIDGGGIGRWMILPRSCESLAVWDHWNFAGYFDDLLAMWCLNQKRG